MVFVPAALAKPPSLTSKIKYARHVQLDFISQKLPIHVSSSMEIIVLVGDMKVMMDSACADQILPSGMEKTASAVSSHLTLILVIRNARNACLVTTTLELNALLQIVQPPTLSIFRNKNVFARGIVQWKKREPAGPAKMQLFIILKLGHARPAQSTLLSPQIPQTAFVVPQIKFFLGIYGIADAHMQLLSTTLKTMNAFNVTDTLMLRIISALTALQVPR